MAAQLFPLDDLPAVFEKELQDLKWLFLQLHPDALPAQFAAEQVELNTPNCASFEVGADGGMRTDKREQV